MRKVRLDIEALEVESFDTGDGDGGKGTVRGHATYVAGCNSQGSNCQSCQLGCPQDTLTCFASCAAGVTKTYDPETECFGDPSRLPCINPYC